MASTDLLFGRAPNSSQPVNLVFGDTGGGGIAAVTLSANSNFPALRVTGTLAVKKPLATLTGYADLPPPTLSGTLLTETALTGTPNLPGLSVNGAAVYDSRTERPGVRQVRTPAQQGAPVAASFAANWQDGQAMRRFVAEVWQDGAPAGRSVSIQFEEAMALVQRRAVRWQDGVPVTRGTTIRWQESDRTRLDRADRAQDGVPVQQDRAFLWQDTLRLRNQAAARWQEAAVISALRRDGAGYGPLISAARKARFQEAMYPQPGRWPGRPIPPIFDPCYVPPLGGAVELIFADAWDGSADLLFVCERHVTPPEPGATVVVPIKRVYVVLNSASLRRVDGNIALPTKTMSMSLDVDSWTWSFSAALPGRALADIEPSSAGGPVEVEATVNGVPYRFLIESIGRDRSFGTADIRVGGRGKSALLDAPYAPTQNFRNTSARTAQQLFNDVLTDNGVSLGWGVNWQPVDWSVPAGVFSSQGSYMNALTTIATAAGAYVQPHNTDQSLSVLLRYPTAPWVWGTVTPDFELPSAVTQRETIDWVEKPRYNRVYVSGQQSGILGRVTRSGTAGDLLAPMVTDALTTHAEAARQRGISVLADTGRVATVGLRLPVLAETGIIPPGKFVRYTDNGVDRIGITRAVSVEASMPQIYQTVTVETHVESV